MTKAVLRHIGFAIVIYLVTIILWRLWVPNVTSFEAPGWDESDRARDALIVFRALMHFNPLPFLSQLVFFQTWGPLFAVFAQIPLYVFGPNAQSLTFVSFSGLIFAAFGTFRFVHARLGWFAAVATCLFAFFWLVSAPRFGSYFVIMMLESWVIVGWIGIAVAGAIGDVGLLVVASWILFAAKYQYYPIFFVTFMLYVLWNWRTKLVDFAKDFFTPRWTRVLLAIAALLILHVLIMKTAGPIYGKITWNQPRALRNPVLVTFIIGTILLYARREVFFAWFVERSWEETYIKWFFWPATVLLAFPWPNRWAGIMVTQAYQTESHSVLDTCEIYTREIVGSLQTPEPVLAILGVLVLALIVGVFTRAWSFKRLDVARGKDGTVSTTPPVKKFDFKSLPFFVSAVFIVQILVLLFAVKNLQTRFAFAIFFSVPIGLFAYALSRLNGLLRQLTSAAVAIMILAIFIATPYFRPASFFLSNLFEATNATYFSNTALYPLDSSLGPLVSEAAKKVPNRPVRFAIVQKDPEWLWDRPMQIWPIEFELHSGVASEAFTYANSTNYCDLAKVDQVDLVVKATASSWETVACP